MAINLDDYSRTAAQKGWGAGWPSCSGAKAAGTAVVTASRSKVRLSVHKRVARLVQLVIDETERRGYLLRDGQCGGYNCRAISGTSTASNHSWGLAADINWQANPYVGPRRTDMPGWMPLLWNRYGFAWGGNYTGSKQDSMHYEFMGSPADADAMTALALAELAAPAPVKDWFDMANYADLVNAVEEVINRQRPRQGSGMTGTTSIASIAQWTDYAWNLDAGRVDRLAELIRSSAGSVAGPATLTDTDVQRIAEAVAKLLGQRISAPGA